MNINEMRKKFREKKNQVDDTSSEKMSVDQEIGVSNNDKPAKSGDSSSVSVDEPTYHYERGSNTVLFECSRICNLSDEPTGHLSLNCWISTETRNDDGWQNDNYAFADDFDLGHLLKGTLFTNICHTFTIPDNLVKIVNDMNNVDAEWHFVFTVNELHEDGNNYIVHTVNGPNENAELSFPFSEESISIHKLANGAYKAFLNEEPFTGTLYSSNKLFEIEFKDSDSTYIFCYHKNGELAVGYTFDDRLATCYFIEEGEGVSKEEFEQKYGKRFDRIFSSGLAEVDANLSYDDEEEDSNTSDKTSSHTDSTYRSDVYNTVVSILEDKLGVDSSEISYSSTLSDLGADSLDAVELVMECEKEFGINIPDDEAERIRTVGDAVRYIERHS